MEWFILMLLTIPITNYINKKTDNFLKMICLKNNYKIIVDDKYELIDYLYRIVNYIPGINIAQAIINYKDTVEDPLLIDSLLIDERLEKIKEINGINIENDDLDEIMELPLLLEVCILEYQGSINYVVITNNTKVKEVIYISGSLSYLSKLEQKAIMDSEDARIYGQKVFDYPNTDDDYKLYEYAVDALDKYFSIREENTKNNKELKKVHKQEV